MKRALIIAHLGDASPRIPSLTRFFKDFGWETTIVSPKLDESILSRIGADKFDSCGINVLYTEYKGDKLEWIRRLFTKRGFNTNESITEQVKSKTNKLALRSLFKNLVLLYQELFCFPDSEGTWIKPAKKFLKKLLAVKSGSEKTLGNNSAIKNFDVVISSSPYPTTHVIAHWIKKNYGIPWIAEFRDPWSDNHNSTYGFLRKKIDLMLEKKLLKEADHIIAVLPKIVENYSRKHKKPVTLIHNGYSPDSVATSHNLPHKLTINYTGAIYEKKQDVELLMKALKIAIDSSKPLRNEPPQLQINFVGKPVALVQQLTKDFGLSDYVNFMGSMPHKEALKIQTNSHVLLILGWNDEIDTGVYPTKFFEYMAARRPIMIIGGPKNEEIKLLVNKAKAGFTASTLDETVNIFKHLIDTFKKKNDIPFNTNVEFFERFNCKHLAKAYCKILDQIS